MLKKMLKKLMDKTDNTHKAAMLPADYQSAAEEASEQKAAYYFEQGVSKSKQQEYTEAIAAYQQAIAIKPNYPEAYAKLSELFRQLNQWDDALAACQMAIALDPMEAQYYVECAGIFFSQGNLAGALKMFAQADNYKPNDVKILSDMGFILCELGKLEEAIAILQRAVSIAKFVPAYMNLGVALSRAGRFAEVCSIMEQAKALMPNYAQIYLTLGNALNHQNNFSAALNTIQQAMELEPDLPIMRLSYALTLLKQGNYEEGWRQHEVRKVTPFFEPYLKRYEYFRKWHKGVSITGKTILVHAEQGYGDIIQFVRYVPEIAKHTAGIILDCPSALIPLFQGMEGVTQIVNRIDEIADLNAIDFCCPMLSLPYLCETTLATIPATVPYLKPNDQLLEKWRDKLTDHSKQLKIGLVWAGSTRKTEKNLDLVFIDKRRSIKLMQFAPLGDIKGVQFYSLQKGEPAGEIKTAPASLKLIDYTDEITSFADTAAIIANLDLIITVDTAVAHLAGALAKPTWILNRYDSCWRWLSNREDSPWYPTVRLFNQETSGDWATVITKVQQALQQLVLTRSEVPA